MRDLNYQLKKFRKIETKDLREVLLDQISLSNKLDHTLDIEDLIALLSSLGPLWWRSNRLI